MERKKSLRRRKSQKSWWKKCKEYLRQFVAFMFSNVGIIVLVIGYTIAGSIIFQAIEASHEMDVKKQLKANRTIFANKLWNITDELNRLAHLRDKEMFRKNVTDVFLEYQQIFVSFARKGFDGSENANCSESWSFFGGFLYSLTVITTIGYGNTFPHTNIGKITTIIYAIIGMPLFLLYLSNIGDIMARSFKWIYANCCLCRWCPGVAKRRAMRRIKREQRMTEEWESEEEGSEGSSRNTGSNIEMSNLGPRDSPVSETYTGYTEEESYDVQNVTVPVTICLAIMVGYICGGALLFCQWEKLWSFRDAAYFCFISLSTIGFGDLVPNGNIYGKGNELSDVLKLSFVFCSLYLLLGMALIAMCFNLMQEEVIHKIRATIQTVQYVMRCNR